MPLEDQVKQMTSHMLALRRIQDKSEMEFLASLGGLSLPQLNVLNVVGDSEPCTMGEIAKRVSLSLSSVTLIVDKLVKLKLITRIRSEEDRRIVYAKLAAAGQKIYQVQIEHMHFINRKLLTMLSSEEKNMLLKIMNKLTMATAIA